MSYEPPETFNIADYFLDARIREGRGDSVALWPATSGSLPRRPGPGQSLRERLASPGLEPEQRVLIALPDGPDYVGALFGVFKLGAVVVMVNPGLPDEIAYFLDYTRARVAVVTRSVTGLGRGRPGVALAASGSSSWATTEGRHPRQASWARAGRARVRRFETSPPTATTPPLALLGRHDRPAQGRRPDAPLVRQHHRALRQGHPRLPRGDVTLSVPKLYFGYATGSNLFFPFSAGATAVLFPEHATPEVLFERIRRHRPTMLDQRADDDQQMVSHPEAATQDLSCLRFATSAGEALPAELYAAGGTPSASSCSTASAPPRCGTSSSPTGPATCARARSDRSCPASRCGCATRTAASCPRARPAGCGCAAARAPSATGSRWSGRRGFRGEWYVSGDLVSRDADGYVTYCGRGDEMLKVSGKWLAPAEVEGCLLEHPAVAEARWWA